MQYYNKRLNFSQFLLFGVVVSIAIKENMSVVILFYCVYFATYETHSTNDFKRDSEFCFSIFIRQTNNIL